jgi:hypothetical protein
MAYGPRSPPPASVRRDLPHPLVQYNTVLYCKVYTVCKVFSLWLTIQKPGSQNKKTHGTVGGRWYVRMAGLGLSDQNRAQATARRG